MLVYLCQRHKFVLNKKNIFVMTCRNLAVLAFNMTFSVQVCQCLVKLGFQLITRMISDFIILL